MAHVRRDLKRGVACTVSQYKEAIHFAVCSRGHEDFYTGERLDWKLVSVYRNEEAKSGKVKYKKTLSLLPTVDHTEDEHGQPCFVICSWRVNDAKSDLTLGEFYSLCERVLAHRESAGQGAAPSTSRG